MLTNVLICQEPKQAYDSFIVIMPPICGTLPLYSPDAEWVNSILHPAVMSYTVQPKQPIKRN